MCIFVLLQRANHGTQKTTKTGYRHLSLKKQYCPTIQILLQERGLLVLSILADKPGSEHCFQTSKC